MEDMREDETQTIEDKEARLLELGLKVIARSLGQIPCEDETDEYFRLRRELTGV